MGPAPPREERAAEAAFTSASRRSPARRWPKAGVTPSSPVPPAHRAQRSGWGAASDGTSVGRLPHAKPGASRAVDTPVLSIDNHLHPRTPQPQKKKKKNKSKKKKQNKKTTNHTNTTKKKKKKTQKKKRVVVVGAPTPERDVRTASACSRGGGSNGSGLTSSRWSRLTRAGDPAAPTAPPRPDPNDEYL